MKVKGEVMREEEESAIRKRREKIKVSERVECCEAAIRMPQDE